MDKASGYTRLAYILRCIDGTLYRGSIKDSHRCRQLNDGGASRCTCIGRSTELTEASGVAKLGSRGYYLEPTGSSLSFRIFVSRSMISDVSGRSPVRNASSVSISVLARSAKSGKRILLE
jgi:hypothetical protein